MKYITILLLSFLILLGGCNTYPKDDVLEGYGYELKDNESYVLKIGDSASIYTYWDPYTESVAADVYINNYQGVSLRFNKLERVWEGQTEVEPKATYSEATSAKASDVYAYMLSVEPKIESELEKISEYKKIPLDELQNGDKEKIIEKLATNIKITNPKLLEISKNSEELGRNEYILQINFDISNNTKEDIEFSNLDTMLCYSISIESGQCNSGPTIDQSESNLSGDTLKSNSTENIQYTTIVPADAIDFYISVIDSTQENIHATSELVNK